MARCTGYNRHGGPLYRLRSAWSGLSLRLVVLERPALPDPCSLGRRLEAAEPSEVLIWEMHASLGVTAAS